MGAHWLLDGRDHVCIRGENAGSKEEMPSMESPNINANGKAFCFEDNIGSDKDGVFIVDPKRRRQEAVGINPMHAEVATPNNSDNSKTCYWWVLVPRLARPNEYHKLELPWAGLLTDSTRITGSYILKEALFYFSNGS